MPSLIATLGANIAPFLRSLDEAQGKSQKKGDDIGSALGGNLTKSLGKLVSVAAIGATIRSTVEYGSKINDLAARLGISTTAVQEWDYALKQSGSSIDAAAPFFEKLAISRDKALRGNPELIEHYKKLGLTVSQLAGMRTNDIGSGVARAYELGDPQALVESLRAVGGKGAVELVAAFRDGLAGKLAEALVISPEGIANLDRADDALARIAHTLRGLSAGPISGAVDLFDKVTVGWKAGLAIVSHAWETGSIDIKAGFPAMAEHLKAKEADEKRREDSRKRRTSLEEDEKAEKAPKMSTMKEYEELMRKKADKEKRESEKEYDKAQEKAKKDGADKFADLKNDPFQKTSLQSIGGFLGQMSSPELSMLETTKKSEQHLAEIRRHITRQSLYEKAANMGAGWGDTQF